MVPILLLSNNLKDAENFVINFVEENNIAISNIFRFKPEKSAISIDQIREVEKLFVRSVPAMRLVVLYDFQTAKLEAQNALLKTLEEKSSRVQFIVIASDIGSILPTIISRCLVKKIQSIKSKPLLLNLDQPVANLLVEATILKKNSPEAIVFCDELIALMRQKLRQEYVAKQSRLFFSQIVREILVVRNLIVRNNINQQLAIDHLLYYINSLSKQTPIGLT